MQARNSVPAFLEPFLGHGTCGHGGRRQACRGAAAAARIADAVLLEVGVVGMTGTKALRDIGVILAALIGVADQQGNRRARGPAFVDAGENLHRIGLVALRDELAGAGATTIQIMLDVRLAQGHARGQPSITQPMAGPWDSPKLVTVKIVPKVLPLIGCRLSLK
jgi:hypothetical protein